MEIIKNLSQGTYYVTLNGKFTFNDHPEFREILQRISAEDVNMLILQMSGLEFVDSAALGMLLLALDETGKYKKNLIISGATGQVKRMFDMARFNTLFVMN